jgi:hypothetical protein
LGIALAALSFAEAVRRSVASIAAFLFFSARRISTAFVRRCRCGQNAAAREAAVASRSSQSVVLATRARLRDALPHRRIPALRVPRYGPHFAEEKRCSKETKSSRSTGFKQGCERRFVEGAQDIFLQAFDGVARLQDRECMERARSISISMRS